MMLNMPNLGDPDELVKCPFNPTHCLPRKRLVSHIYKCRHETSEHTIETATCKFNDLHIFPKRLIEMHESTCADRLIRMSDIYKRMASGMGPSFSDTDIQDDGKHDKQLSKNGAADLDTKIRMKNRRLAALHGGHLSFDEEQAWEMMQENIFIELVVNKIASDLICSGKGAESDNVCNQSVTKLVSSESPIGQMVDKATQVYEDELTLLVPENTFGIENVISNEDRCIYCQFEKYGMLAKEKEKEKHGRQKKEKAKKCSKGKNVNVNKTPCTNRTYLAYTEKML